jgi:hypothetical protein
VGLAGDGRWAAATRLGFPTRGRRECCRKGRLGAGAAATSLVGDLLKNSPTLATMPSISKLGPASLGPVTEELAGESTSKDEAVRFRGWLCGSEDGPGGGPGVPSFIGVALTELLSWWRIEAGRGSVAAASDAAAATPSAFIGVNNTGSLIAGPPPTAASLLLLVWPPLPSPLLGLLLGDTAALPPLRSELMWSLAETYLVLPAPDASGDGAVIGLSGWPWPNCAGGRDPAQQQHKHWQQESGAVCDAGASRASARAITAAEK